MASFRPRVPPTVVTAPQQYQVAGVRWLESTQDEVVHFVCLGGTPFVIGLDEASLAQAGIGSRMVPEYLEALRQAVADWAERLDCRRFRVEANSPFPNVRVRFDAIDAAGTLATATRAGDIVLDAERSWFPGGAFGRHQLARGAVSFYWVVAHELGHVFGLAHSDRADSLMHATQCRTCGWSSYEQAGANVIRAASADPRWSRPHYANRFFAKTPMPVLERLLRGELPEDVEASAGAEEQCEILECAAEDREGLDALEGCRDADPPPAAVLGPTRLPGTHGRSVGSGEWAGLEPAAGGPARRRTPAPEPGSLADHDRATLPTSARGPVPWPGEKLADEPPAPRGDPAAG